MTTASGNPLSPAKVEIKNKNSHSLLSYDEIPPWYQDNDCIRHGYRPVTNRTKTCFESWTYLHNETANIYSHLLPSLLAIASQGFIHKAFPLYHPQATMSDYKIVAFHLCSASICFGFSALYHTLMNRSARCSTLWARIDYIGIIVLILGDFVSGIYVGFYCEPILQKTYWTMVRTHCSSQNLSLPPVAPEEDIQPNHLHTNLYQITTLTALTASIVVHPSHQSRQYRLFRLSVFILTGLSALAPIIHATRIFPREQLSKQSGLPYYFAEGGIILVGVLIYGTRFPEKLYPGRFDMRGSSHQMFHVLVVLGTGVHLRGVFNALEWNYYENRRCRD